MDEIVCHVAIADDWEMSDKFGEYEVATRGLAWEPGDYIRACVEADVDEVVERVFGDLRLPLVVVRCRVAALAAHGVDVEWVDGQPRIGGPIPMASDAVEVVPLAR